MIGDDKRGGGSHGWSRVAHMVLRQPTQRSPQPAPAARLEGAFGRPQAICWNWENLFSFFASFREIPPAATRYLKGSVVILVIPSPTRYSVEGRAGAWWGAVMGRPPLLGLPCLNSEKKLSGPSKAGERWHPIQSGCHDHE